MMVLYIDAMTERFWWMRYRDRSGGKPPGIDAYRRLAGGAAKLRERLQARDDTSPSSGRESNLIFNEWVDFFWRTTPSRRFAREDARGQMRAGSSILKKAFGARKVGDISTRTTSSTYLRRRLQIASGQNRGGFVCSKG
jgi:hypothetical protein